MVLLRKSIAKRVETSVAGPEPADAERGRSLADFSPTASTLREHANRRRGDAAATLHNDDLGPARMIKGSGLPL